jgi:putative restriction endonuclease
MGNYNSCCAISGIDISDLLIASHIIPWNTNEKERLNPENGICLSSLYDKAFDKGYLTVNEQLKVVLSPELKRNLHKKYYEHFFKPFEGEQILSPQKYLPKKEFLQYHFDVVFLK